MGDNYEMLWLDDFKNMFSKTFMNVLFYSKTEFTVDYL